MTTLYTLSNGKLRVWIAFAEGSEVVVQHGQLGGKIVEKRYTAEPKNTGRANATTAEQQAEAEVEAKVVKQLKSGYFRTVDEAQNYVPFQPMKAQDYKNQAKKIKLPVLQQPKLNGQRLMIDANGDAWSKQGEKLELPAHWVGIREMAVAHGGLDGEVYAGLESEGGLSLQEIISAFRKPNENTPRLMYWVYDIPAANTPMRDRSELLKQLELFCDRHNIQNVAVVNGIIAHTHEEMDEYYARMVALGFEGVVYRNEAGLYEFGKRSHDLIKRKPRLDAEALVLSYTLDKNNEPVYLVHAVNGEQDGSEFKLKMKIPKEGTNYRSALNAEALVGQHINYEYEELSDDNIPTKPVGISVREVVRKEGRW